MTLVLSASVGRLVDCFVCLEGKFLNFVQKIMRTGIVCIQGKRKKQYKEAVTSDILDSENALKKTKLNSYDKSPSLHKSYTRDIIKSLCDTIKRSTKKIFSFKFFDKNNNEEENKENEAPSRISEYKVSYKGPFSYIEMANRQNFSTLSMIPLDRKFCITDPNYVETVSTSMTLTSLEKYLKLKKRILRRSKSSVLPTHAVCSTSDINKFVWLIEEDPMISLFLKRDICRRYADKYLLAMVLIYFARAHFSSSQFSRENFFAALYLAHDMEEDHEEIKYEVFPYCLGIKWKTYYTYLLSIRDDLFWALDCRAVVSRKCCEQVMSLMPDHWIWERERPEYHAIVDFSRNPDEKSKYCQPRGPFKTPLWCRACLERECLDSENSYIIYSSDSSFSSYTSSSGTDCEKSENNKKDSGFESFLFPNENKESNGFESCLFPNEKDSKDDDENLDTSLHSDEVLADSPLGK